MDPFQKNMLLVIEVSNIPSIVDCVLFSLFQLEIRKVWVACEQVMATFPTFNLKVWQRQ